MKIFHVHNTANVAKTLAHFQNVIGLKASVSHDRANKFERIQDLYSILSSDIIHYHSNTWIRRGILKHLDYKVLKWLKKGTLLFHFHGSDLRVGRMEHELRKMISESKKVLVSTPDLLNYFVDGKALWMPNPIDLTMWKRKIASSENKVIHVGYYNPPTPDTYTNSIYECSAIRKVIWTLRLKGFNIQAHPVYGIPRSKMPDYFQTLDIFVDRLGMGWYGLCACEAMASGIATITFIREDLEALLPDRRPFLISSAHDLEYDLSFLIESEELRKDFGRNGYDYVNVKHNGIAVTKELVSIYEEARQ